jgi:hypothetical protein
MLPAGFEPAIPASERPHTHALDRVTTGIGWKCVYILMNISGKGGKYLQNVTDAVLYLHNWFSFESCMLDLL